MLLYHGELAGHQGIQHFVQVHRRQLDIGAFALPSTGFGD
jgi:hypothetical protein